MVNNLFYGFDLTKVVGNTLLFIIALIAIDVITGLLASAKQKQLNSKVNFNGLIKKVGELVLLVFITLIDTYFKANGQVIKLGTAMIILYETMSIIENFKVIGWDLTFVTRFFLQSQNTSEPNKTSQDTAKKTTPIVTQEDYNKEVSK